MKSKIRQTILCSVVLLAFNVFAQNNDVKKEWSFQNSRGTLQVSAMSFPSSSGARVTRLELSPSARGTWTVAEEAKALDSVLKGFPNAGFDLRSVASISVRLNEDDALGRLAVHLAQSKTWRGMLKTRNPGRFYPLVVASLNDSGAYKELNDIFTQRSMGLRVVSVEKVDTEPFSKSGAKCPTGANCANLLVPSDALVQMNIVPLVGRNP